MKINCKWKKQMRYEIMKNCEKYFISDQRNEKYDVLMGKIVFSGFNFAGEVGKCQKMIQSKYRTKILGKFRVNITLIIHL